MLTPTRSPLDEILTKAYEAQGGRGRPNAQVFDVDPATYSKLLSGAMPFTAARAEKWAAKLTSGETGDTAELASKILEAGKLAVAPQTVDAFFRSVEDEGGAVPAVRIEELFNALTGPNVRNALFAIEYRDRPRTTRSSKYSGIGFNLAKAVANGLTVAMFMPFGVKDTAGAPDEPRPSRNTFDYMRRVRDECRDLYLLLKEESELNAQELGHTSKGEVRLYERNPDLDYFGSGLGAKFGYIQFEYEESGSWPLDYRILQWISTPAKDIIVYRGKNEIPYEAVRDSLFPVPQYFLHQSQIEKNPKLPTLCRNTTDEERKETFRISRKFGGERDFPSSRDEFWLEYCTD